MQLLALDIGERRIGLASADTATRIAVPAGVIERRDDADAVQAVLREAEIREAEQVIAGIPLSLSGQPGPQAETTEAFIAALREQTRLPIVAWDERYSTAEAERRLYEARAPLGRGKSRRAPRGAVDAAAAAVILQSYLDANPAI